MSLYSCLPKCYPPTTLGTANVHTILMPHVMIKQMIVILNLAWRVLTEENKDNLLQFAKVFPTKFLKLPIRQSFILPPFCTIRYVWPRPGDLGPCVCPKPEAWASDRPQTGLRLWAYISGKSQMHMLQVLCITLLP